MTFLQWLYEQRGRRDAVGAFSDLATSDRSGRKPRIFHTKPDWVAHLSDAGAPEDVLSAFDAAWGEWAGSRPMRTPDGFVNTSGPLGPRSMRGHLLRGFQRQTGWRERPGAEPCPAKLFGKRHRIRGCRYCWDDDMSFLGWQEDFYATLWTENAYPRAITFHKEGDIGHQMRSWFERNGLSCTWYTPDVDWVLPGKLGLYVLTAAHNWEIPYNPLAALGWEFY